MSAQYADYIGLKAYGMQIIALILSKLIIH